MPGVAVVSDAPGAEEKEDRKRRRKHGFRCEFLIRFSQNRVLALAASPTFVARSRPEDRISNHKMSSSPANAIRDFVAASFLPICRECGHPRALTGLRTASLSTQSGRSFPSWHTRPIRPSEVDPGRDGRLLFPFRSKRLVDAGRASSPSTSVAIRRPRTSKRRPHALGRWKA
jgi:hypothetical protein